MKIYIRALCTAILLALAFSQSALANANITPINILFEHSTAYQYSRGVTYYRSRMMTINGMLDVHVLRVDLQAPYISVAPVSSSTELGLRETTTSLLNSAGAIAGINADFFGMAGAYSTHFGPMVQDGELLGVGVSTNHNFNEFATFFLDNNNNPFFRYVRNNIQFVSGGVDRVRINAYNNIGHALDWPVAVSRAAMYDTSALNRRFNNLTKIVVENETVRHISQSGEAVTVPENGFVVILPQRFAYRTRYFTVGDSAWLFFSNNSFINYANIQAAIGGGGLILQNGQVVNDRGAAPAGRHPRSAIGSSACGRYLILLTVDGRSHSVGATHNEMAYLLYRFGAYDAMHFDGGGSSTLVASNSSRNLQVVNTPSDGGQRRVINALGVFDNAPKGDMHQLILEPNVPHAVVGIPIDINVFGEDEYWNYIAIDRPYVILSTLGEEGGTWYNNQFTPSQEGPHTILATYGEFQASITIYAYHLAELVPVTTNVSLFEGERASLNFVGITTCGKSVLVPSVGRLNVTPAYLGRFENGIFVATRGGAGFITATIGNTRAYIPVSVGDSPTPVNMFEGELGSLSLPAGNFTHVTRIEANRPAIRMDYNFVRSTATQAAYATFYPALIMPMQNNQNPVGLRLQVYGDGSGHWLRGRIRDAEGDTHLIDFTHSADFIGWESVIAHLPNAPGPLTLDQIYMVSLNSYEITNHSVIFYRLEALFASISQLETPQRPRFTDPLRATGTPSGTLTQLTIPNEANYSVRRNGNFAVATIEARGGGIASANRNQWGRFMQDIRLLDTPYVVILMDANPLTFRQAMEFELFHLAMQELHNEGRMVFVVSATGEEISYTIRDGVRYINLAEDEDATISFWVDGNELRWSN